MERVKTFKVRAEQYFQLFMMSCPTGILDRLPYMHYLRNHVGDLMEKYVELFGWGYGMFSCNAGEHLNKIIKTKEMAATNMDCTRFCKIIRNMRMKQFCYTDSIIPSTVTIRCSACQEIGHNKRNKSCRLHESHPEITFSDSEHEE